MGAIGPNGTCNSQRTGAVSTDILGRVKFVALRTSRSGRQIIVHTDFVGTLVDRYLDDLFWGQMREPSTLDCWLSSVIVIAICGPADVEADFHSVGTAEVEAEFPDALCGGPFDMDWVPSS